MPNSHSKNLIPALQDAPRILIIKPSSLGDIVHALPVLHALRSRWPAAEIDWLIGKSFAPLLEHHPTITRLVPFDRALFSRMWRSPAALGKFVGLLRELRKRKYDVVIDLQGLFRSGYLTWKTRSPIRIGFREAREFAWKAYTHFIPSLGPDAHAVDRNMAVCDMLGCNANRVEFDLAVTSDEQRLARELLANNGVSNGTRWIAVIPGARWETKLWPGERFSRLIDEFHQSQSCQCVLLGAPDEADRCRAIVEKCTSNVMSLVGKTNVRMFAVLLGLADAVICQDSAAAHLAAAQHRPLVCITGPTNPHRTGPYRYPQGVARLNIPCSPCYLRKLSDCPHAHRCMNELPVSEVIRVLNLAGLPAGGGF